MERHLYGSQTWEVSETRMCMMSLFRVILPPVARAAHAYPHNVLIVSAPHCGSRNMEQ